jgi:hypothetical protein
MQHKQRQRLEELCKQIAPQLPAEAVLSALGLLEQFPYLAKAFSSGQHFYGAPAQQPGDAWPDAAGCCMRPTACPQAGSHARRSREAASAWQLC